MEILDQKIILASKSPRRSQLLEQAGFNFEIRAKSIDESFPADMPREQVAPYLAARKAEASKAIIGTGEILLAADSIVLLDEEIFEKPVDYDDAVRILRRLSGRVHRVITGVCLQSISHRRVFSGISDVEMEELSEEEIAYYINRFQPFDKAGAYAIQEWIGLCKIRRIEGTYSNIMGLPMALLYKELEAFIKSE